MLGLLFTPLLSFAAFSFFDATDTAKVPKTLSQLGIYSNLGTRTLDTAFKYYAVNAALWSDGARKKRWIALPKGKHITYNDSTDYFEYPDSTVFVKLFQLERNPGDTNTFVDWETRVLVNKKTPEGQDEWQGFSYKWNAAATDANLVNPNTGFDTVFYEYPMGTAQGTGSFKSYKKWKFPPKAEEGCQRCHRPSADASNPLWARGVLGFFPAQLKRNAPLQPGINQVQWLFNKGVFTGTTPTPTQLASRWKGMDEAISTTLSPDDRFRSLDTMARAYIGSNCSGCHGKRGIKATSGIPSNLNYDFYNLKPAIEFGLLNTNDAGLQEPSTSTDLAIDGRYKYEMAIDRSGLNHAIGSTWSFAYPDTSKSPTLIFPGFPMFSTMLYRQLAMRNTPWRDSLALRTKLAKSDTANMTAWVFANPWGSQAWRDALVAHQVSINSVLNFGVDGHQMPEIATFIPDTAALKILGEWAKNYRTLYVVDSNRIITSLGAPAKTLMAGKPHIRNHRLVVPQNWSGPVLMISPMGRVYRLQHAEPNQYLIPTAIPQGIYFFKMGKRSFRLALFS